MQPYLVYFFTEKQKELSHLAPNKNDRVIPKKDSPVVAFLV